MKTVSASALEMGRLEKVMEVVTTLYNHLFHSVMDVRHTPKVSWDAARDIHTQSSWNH
jgi:hypothetical protein